MKYVKHDDWLEIRLGSIISDYDRRLITILYQPSNAGRFLVGHFG